MNASSMNAALSTILLLHTIAISPEESILAKSATPKCGVRNNNTNWWQLSSGLELMFGDIQRDYTLARDLCKSHNAILPYGAVVDSIRPCLEQRESDDYYWLQTCSNKLEGRVFSVTKTRNALEEEHHNFVCVITTDIKTDLTIQVEDQSNTTYSSKGTKNIFQAWTGQTLKLSCESALPIMFPLLCVTKGNSGETCSNSNIWTLTPENCEDDITMTCWSFHCPEDIVPAAITDVSIKVQCPLEIVSFTSYNRHDTGGIGLHMYNMEDDVTFTCVTKGSSDVTIVKIQGMKMRGTVVSRNHTYSVTGFSCDDMGTYYCIAKQGDTQVNRSINIAVHGLCPPRLCSEETQRKRSLDMKTAGQPVTVCVMAYPVLSDIVSFNGQNVLCDGGISSSPWQCSIKKSQHFMAYSFTFIIHTVPLLVDKTITIGLKTSEGGVLNLTYNLDRNGGLYLVTPVSDDSEPTAYDVTTTTPSLTSPNEVSEDNSVSTAAAVLAGVIICAVIFLATVTILCIFMKKRRKRRSHIYHRPLPRIPDNTGSNRGRYNTDDEPLYSSVIEYPIRSRPDPIETRGNFQGSRQSQFSPLMVAESEPNTNVCRYQNLRGFYWRLNFPRRPAAHNSCRFCEQLNS